MKLYKQSIFVSLNSGELHNFRNGKRITMTNELYKEYLDCFEKLGEGYESTNILHNLVGMGFLVAFDTNEMDVLRYQGNKKIYGDELLELTLIMTDGCNFRCRYCYQKDHVNFMGEDIFNNLISFIEKAAKLYKCIRIDWFGGEPLLAADKTIKFMEKTKEFCKENKTLLISNMTTNGYLLNPNLFRKLIKNRILYYQITIDGISSTHNRLRPLKNGGNTFETILNNLKQIRDTVSERNFKILIRNNITKDMLDSMDDYIVLMAKEFGHDTRFLFYPTLVREWGGDRISEMKNSLLSHYNSIDEIHRKFKELGLREPNIYQNYAKEYICSASRANGFIVNYDGTLHKCTLAMESSDFEIRRKNNVGYIDKYGNMHIDEAKQSLWVNNRSYDEGECKDCKIYPFCMGTGCKYRQISSPEKPCHWKNELFV